MNAISEIPVIVKGACPHDCPDACALEVTVKNGKAISIHGAKNHPTTHGVLCTKVTYALDRTYHPDRVLHPLKRIGNKGEGKFVHISWDEALKEIATQWQHLINTCGAESILPYSYAGNMGILNYQSLGHRFFYAMGASQLDRTICSSAGGAGMTATLGAGVGTRMEQLANAELIIIWGSNPITSPVHSWSFIQQAKKKGARVIAIDPYKSLTAQKCDEYVAIKQGTDAALALGLMHCLVRDNKLDVDYLEKYTLGWPEFRDTLQAWTVEKVSSITEIPAAQIESLAALYGAAKKSIIRANYGLNRHAGGGMAVRTIACLPALTGAWREAAGGFLLSSSGHYPLDKKYLERPDLMPQKKPRMVNMSQLGDALTKLNDPPIRAMYVYNSNPVVVAPDSNAVIAGMKREDLFTVVHDTFLTDTARYADIVLPATTHVENFDIHRSYGHTSIVMNQPAIAPLGESKSNTDTFRALATAMGMTEPALHESDESIARNAFDWQHSSMRGLSFEKISIEGWAQMPIEDAPFANGNFPSPSGKVEFLSAHLAAQGIDPMPTYIPPVETNDAALTKKYPLALNTPPYRHFMNSTFANVHRYRKDHPEPTLEIHPRDAKLRGIETGLMLRVFNDRGAVLLKAVVTENATRGCVTAQSLWWAAHTRDGQGINALTSQRLTDIGAGATFYDCQVEVARA